MKRWSKSKRRKQKSTLPILITEKKNTQPLLGQDWLDKREIGIQGSHETNIIRNITASERGEKIFEEFENFFKKNPKIKDIQLKKVKKTYPTKRETNTHTLSKDSKKRTREVNRKRTLGKTQQNDRKLLRFTSRHNNQKR